MKIIHITDSHSWAAAQEEGIYTADSLKTDGFIHCCLDSQLEDVLDKWFAGAHDLILLELDTGRLDAKLVFENLEGGQEQFPHIYGPINLNAVTSYKKLKR